MEIQAAIVLVLVFFLMFAMNISVSFSIILASLLIVIMFLTSGFRMFVSAQGTISGIDSFTLLVVSFLVLTGPFMSSGGIAKRLINLVMLFLGKVPGSLIITNIASGAIFGSISGSDIAAATAIGGIMLPLGEKQRYDKGFSAAVSIATAPVGQLISPTVSFIVYSATNSGVPVAALFMTGRVPELLWTTLRMAVAYVYGVKHGCVMRRDKMSVAITVKTVWEAIPSLFLIVIVVDSILSDYFTSIGASGVAVAHAFLLSVFVYKSIQIKNIPRILVDAVVMTTVVMLIIDASSVLPFVLSFTGLPQTISSLPLEISDNRIIILLIISITLLIVGTFMDMTPTLLTFTPVFLPIIKSLGMNPAQSGAMIVINLSVGTITPSVGNVLFMGCSVAKLQVEDVMKELLPFFAAIVAALMLITFIPGFSMWLSDILGLLK